jgi:hypothetical protein
MVGGVGDRTAANLEPPVAASPQGTERMAYTRSPGLQNRGFLFVKARGRMIAAKGTMAVCFGSSASRHDKEPTWKALQGQLAP